MPRLPVASDQLAVLAIKTAFEAYQAEFARITRQAPGRFERREWHAGQADARERLELYSRLLQNLVRRLRASLGEAVNDRALWAQMKAAYTGCVQGRSDCELAETFFNSVTRRIFTTVGVDPRIEFVEVDFERPAAGLGEPVFTIYRRRGPLAALMVEILQAYAFAVPYEDPERDARLAAGQIQAALGVLGLNEPPDSIEMIKPVFFRGKGAYLVGQVRCREHALPLALALRNPAGRVFVDAAVLTQDEVSIIFSFTRSYFQVDTERPGDLVAYLKRLLPLKRLAELYTALGHNKHGKTELYRDLRRHLRVTADRFETAWGEKGMVMAVFTLPSFNVVFKIIKDRFPYPKTATRQEVRAKYQLVFQHDRAGRLVDAQEFEHLEFDRARFTDGLLAELLAEAAESVRVEGDRVIIKHLYTERRVMPLNLYVRGAPGPAAREAVFDYGQAIKDLAAANIFPGDLLLKNFGVTRHGRVIFYDYDELCALSECRFRDLPRAASLDEEMSAEPWYYVDEADIFPEEFLQFLGFPAPLRALFLEAHGDLLTAGFWRQMQARHQAGEIVDIFPYKAARRLPRPAGEAEPA
ncbi:MAG: bifunctional isocitrate dehydrogenase kinase/phosphatase [Anaerolineales bacterium]|nr:bifunctional isocitrate dehydrogenase kinase/phosphatase [Anaerolineales bacterium]